MEVIYKFRPGLKFSDGTPMTIDDWAYSLMVFMDPRLPVTGRALEESIDFTKGVGAHGIRGFDILDRYSAKVYFRNTDFIASFAHPGGETVLSRRIIEPLFRRVQETGVMDHFTKAHNVARVPVQIGYFRQTEWRPGTRIIHVRNPHSPFGQPNLDSIIFEIIPDTNALLARIIAGGVDAHWGGLSMSHALVLEERIEALKRINQTWHGKIGYAPWFLVEQIWFNHDSPIMADIRIRKAIAHSINRQQIVDTLFEGRQRVVHSYIAPHHWAYSDDIVKYSYDPARARALLEAAGWRIGPGGIRVKDGVRLTLDLRTVAGDRTREMTQSIIKAQLEEVGIEIDTHRNLPSAAFVSRPHLFARAWPHMAMSGLSPGPLWVLESWWSADSIPRAENAWTGSNLTAYTNLEVTELFREVRREMNLVKRKELMAKILRLISEDLPSLPLFLHINPTYSKLELGRFYPAVATLARYYGHWWWRKDGKP
ncbi:MAG: Oligopeptide-binding protein AppA [candidate division WS2 bacterium]|nr:Oligopeptide-binding protein AppA [Candidatus Psychracetigena formicireducens]